MPPPLERRASVGTMLQQHLTEQEMLNILRKCSVLASLSPANKRLLVHRFEERVYLPGKKIITEGDKEDTTPVGFLQSNV